MMVLVAAQGDRADDFAWTVPGELVLARVSCSHGDTCGCNRAFVGMSSGRGTTVAEIRDMDLTVLQYADAIRDACEQGGWDVSSKSAQEEAAALLILALQWPAGSKVRRNLDRYDAEDGQQV